MSIYAAVRRLDSHVIDRCATPATPLTPRQREVLALLVEGHPNKKIGLKLGLAEITIKMHMSSIFRTLRVTNRTQAVIVARRLGLCPVSEIDEQRVAEGEPV